MKIMIVADVHMRTEVDAFRQKRNFEALQNSFKNNSCDMAVILGDLMHGPDYGDDRNSYIKDLRRALEVINSVPFAFVFGNHDSECVMTKAEILSIINEYDNSLTQGENYVLRRDGETLVFIDSGSEYDGPESHYDVVKPEVIEWAKEQIKGEKAILFQHIIIPDIFDVVEKGNPINIPRFRISGYRFKKGVRFTGELNERPCPPDINTGELETLAPYLKGMVFGHDHINTFECELSGVKIIQCACTSVSGYEWPFQQPTVRMLDTETMTTQIINV